MVLAYISIEGWIIHPDVNSFIYGSDEVLVLSPHNAEVLDGGIMTCDVLMVIYWGGGLQMFLKPLTKSSGLLPYVFIITVHPFAFESVNDATFHCDVIFIFGGHQEAFDGIASSVVHLYPMFTAYVLHALTQASHIWQDHVGFVLALAVAGVFSSFEILFCGCLYLVFHPVEGPVGVLVFFQDLL